MTWDTPTLLATGLLVLALMAFVGVLLWRLLHRPATSTGGHATGSISRTMESHRHEARDAVLIEVFKAHERNQFIEALGNYVKQTAPPVEPPK